MKCKNCGKKLPIRFEVCDYCGAATPRRKYIRNWILMALAAVLLLCAIGGAIVRAGQSPDEGGQTESTAASTTVPGSGTATQQTTLPSQTTVPPTTAQPVETTQPTETAQPTETQPPRPYVEGISFIYNGSNPSISLDPDLSDCVIGALYYLDYETAEVYLICGDTVITRSATDTHVYYVKAEEPTKIYATPKTDFSQHTVIYESAFGDIGKYLYPGTMQFSEALQFVEGGQRFVWLDLTTGEAEVLMEQYYIMHASIDEHGSVAHWREYNIVYFVGKQNEDDELTEYLYYRDTGEIEVCPYL